MSHMCESVRPPHVQLISVVLRNCRRGENWDICTESTDNVKYLSWIERATPKAVKRDSMSAEKTMRNFSLTGRQHFGDPPSNLRMRGGNSMSIFKHPWDKHMEEVLLRIILGCWACWRNRQVSTDQDYRVLW